MHVRVQRRSTSCTEAFTTHAAGVEAGGPAARRLREWSCGAQLSHVTQRRDGGMAVALARGRLSLHIVQLGVPACVTVPEAEQSLAQRRARAELSQEGRKPRPPLALLPQHAATQKRSLVDGVEGRGGAYTTQFPLFSFHVKVLSDQIQKELVLIFTRPFLYGSLLFIPHCISSPPTGCQST